MVQNYHIPMSARLDPRGWMEKLPCCVPLGLHCAFFCSHRWVPCAPRFLPTSTPLQHLLWIVSAFPETQVPIIHSYLQRYLKRNKKPKDALQEEFAFELTHTLCKLLYWVSPEKGSASEVLEAKVTDLPSKNQDYATQCGLHLPRVATCSHM